MQKLSLDALAREHSERAAASGSGRSAETVFGGHELTLRQTIIALRRGVELSEHENPGQATVLVLRGRVELIGSAASWTGRQGDLILVPSERHRLVAHEDAVVLLTVAKLGQ
ncbi:cupin domain-containing protein [Micromonospora coerulea]|uniref:Cupin domain-containing protein n=1 Tax=Micromonospora coerulea TaxID=47856 RepID=A0ABP8SQC1_9ACTN|nr:cupin domain-containing protein [Micromonospora veneta]